MSLRHRRSVTDRSLTSENARMRSVARNAAASYGSFFAQTLAGLFLTPLLLRGLGVRAFGTLTVIQILVAYIVMAEVGIGIATVRRVASAIASREEGELGHLAATSLVLWAAAATVGGLALTALVVTIDHVVHLARPELGAARWALALMGGSELVTLLLNFYPALLYGSGRSDLLTRTLVSITLAGSAAQAIAALLLHSLLAVAAISAGTTLLAALALRSVARRKIAPIGIEMRAFRASLARKLLSSGWRNAFVGVASRASVSSDALIVSAMLTIRAAATYGIAFRVATMMRTLATTGSDVLVPTYAHHAAVEDQDIVYKLLRESVIASLLVAIPAAAAVLGFGEGLLRLWLDDVPSGTLAVLRLLAISVVLAVPGNCAYRLLSGIDRLDFMVVGGGLVAAGNVGLSVLLTLKFGLVGPAIATVAAIGVFEFLILPIYVCRVLDVRSMTLVRDCSWLLAPAVAAAAAAGVGSQLSVSGGTALLGSTGTCLVFFAAAVACAGSGRRARYAALIRRTRSISTS